MLYGKPVQLLVPVLHVLDGEVIGSVSQTLSPSFAQSAFGEQEVGPASSNTWYRLNACPISWGNVLLPAFI